jgi:hypothetical protein
MRAGAEYFTSPGQPAQLRYEALRAYLVDGEPAEIAGARFGYSKATMYQMAAELPPFPHFAKAVSVEFLEVPRQHQVLVDLRAG